MPENNLCIIVIPVYKERMDKNELRSFIQCIKVLGKHTICFVTHKSLNISEYKEYISSCHISVHLELFEASYFKNLSGYNRLMLSKNFYERFSDYKYILIYQLDCYVFRDELYNWCYKDYDYIGAPWFNKFKSYEDGTDLWKVGNGGLSLRKTKTFIDVLNSKKNVYSIKRTYKINKLKEGSFFKFIRMVLTSYENNITYLIKNWTDAEDIFFCLVLEDTQLKIDTPNVEEAKYFAFEQSPKFLLEKCNGILPFGCHAWSRYHYEDFWSKYIK